MKVKKIKKNLILTILLLFVSLFICLSSNIRVVHADNNTIYSNVLDDLKVDENFNQDKYIEDANNNNLQIIQIAESENKELFIYIYQPNISDNYNLTPTTISISTGINDNAKWELYNLTLLNSNNTLFKYKVEELVVKEDALRYYDITEMHRKFIKGLDAETGNDNIVNEVAIKVAQLWTVCTVEDNSFYNLKETEVVEIKDKFVGFVRYKNNTAPSWINKDSVDSHFVAFRTDKNIDKLLEADVEFSSQICITNSDLFVKDKFGAINKEDVKLTYDKKIEIKPDNNHFLWNTNKYSFNEIQTVNEFFESVNLTNTYEHGLFNVTTVSTLSEASINRIKGMQYVLRFANTDYDHFESAALAGPVIIKDTFTIIENVTILRLKFEHDSVTYNLGIVDNKQTGSNNPVNKTDVNYNFDKLFKILKYIGYALLGIALLALIMPFIPWLIMGIIKLIVVILKGLWWFICLPINIFRK